MRARRGVRGKARGREYLSLGQAGEFFCLEALPSFSATATVPIMFVRRPKLKWSVAPNLLFQLNFRGVMRLLCYPE